MRKISFGEIFQNLLAGLTVSFVALSLGAALGVLSERGAFIGMLSAGVSVIITASLGGTRVKCSGPTAPLTVVTAMVVGFAHDALQESVPNMNPDHFVNIVIFLAAVLLFLMAILKMGRYITLIPNVVVSGFMNGIALLIWLDQTQKVFGLGGKTSFEGSFYENIAIVIFSFLLAVYIPKLTQKFLPKFTSYISGTLFTLLIATGSVYLFNFSIETVQLGASISSVSEFSALLVSQFPTFISWGIVWLAFPFAFQLAMLIYLDTLLTSLVLDKMMNEETKREKELVAQGLSTAAVGFFGGLPGAQATIRSVLLIKENATLRIAGVFVGIFVLIELFLFQDAISFIPQAVFSGILFKVGLDILDIKPLMIYASEVFNKKSHLFEKIFSAHRDENIFVTNREMFIILLTIVLTVLFDLITAVGISTVLFYCIQYFSKTNPMRDLAMNDETDGIQHED